MNEKRGTAKQQLPVDNVTSQGEWGIPRRRSERPRVPTCAPRFGRWATLVDRERRVRALAIIVARYVDRDGARKPGVGASGMPYDRFLQHY